MKTRPTALEVVSLFVLACLNLPAQPILKVDFNDRADNTASQTQPGFSVFVLGGAGEVSTPTAEVFGGISVTIAPVGDRCDDRIRTTPANSGALTEAALYRDFIFATSTNTGGLDVIVGGLVPDGGYRFTIWSYDSQSIGNRVSDWRANGIVVTNGYAFNGAARPTFNEQYRFTFRASASASGQVIISGRRNPASFDANSPPKPIGVFLNALQIEAEPRITHIDVSGGKVTLMASPIDPGYPYRIEQTANLAGMPVQWNTVPDTVFHMSTNSFTVRFGASGLVRFYRVR